MEGISINFDHFTHLSLPQEVVFLCWDQTQWMNIREIEWGSQYSIQSPHTQDHTATLEL